MVYQGRPSTGCVNCKKRKIKCDEERPACFQCTSTKRTCPGYVQYFDLVFRDQTKSVQRRAEKKKPKSKQNKSLEAIVAITTLSPVAVTVKAKSQPFSTKCTIPRALVESPEQDAIYSFFTDFILHTNHPDTQCEFYEHLLPLYTSAPPDSVLSLAASAVALIISGGYPEKRPRFEMGRTINGLALKKVALALQDPVQSVQDQTLMAVLLLGFFDRLHNSVRGLECTGPHEGGAVALIRHRERQHHRSELSPKLLFAVYSHVVDTAFQFSGVNVKHLTDLTNLVSSLPQNTANRLTVISARAAQLRALAETVFHTQNVLVSSYEIHQVLNVALEVDSQFNIWAQSVPEGWAWHSASGFDCPPDKPRELFVYEDRIDFYAEPNMAKAWDSYRSRRIIVLSIIFDCLCRLGPSYDLNFSYDARDPLKITQELVDDICASVPYLFGTRTFGGPMDRECFEYPYHGTTKLSADHRQAVAALGAWSLLEPFTTSLSAVGLRPGQKKWIMAQMMRLRNVYSLQGPSTGLQNVPVDALQDVKSGELSERSVQISR